MFPIIYGYARVSTIGQARNGNSLADQEKLLKDAGCVSIYYDHYTGTKMDRPNFSLLLNRLQPGDRLVVTKLDRFARTAAEGITAIRSLLNNNISVHILNMGLIDNTPTGKLMTTMLLGFAEFERDMIVERTQAGKQTAKLNHPDTYREGRPEIILDQAMFQKFREKQKRNEMTVGECCKALGISRSTWYNRLKPSSC